jgi:catechol 2,3-dioxygenase-like lactoylglutathione lyase family enzyme
VTLSLALTTLGGRVSRTEGQSQNAAAGLLVAEKVRASSAIVSRVWRSERPYSRRSHRKDSRLVSIWWETQPRRRSADGLVREATPPTGEQMQAERGEMAIQDVVVVSVPVSDQERAKEFYVEKLGFELTRDESGPDIRWVQVTPKGGTTSLTLVTWFETMPPGSLQGLVLDSEDLQRDCEELLARGVEFDEPPRERPWGTEAVVHDPDGNKLVLHQA